VKRRVSIVGISKKNCTGGKKRERIQKSESCQAGVPVVELHLSLGWKTAFGFHLEGREQKNEKQWRNKMSEPIYLHPDHRPGTNRILQKFWVWIVPYVVWSQKGRRGFVSRSRALDWYYEASRDLTHTAVASIARKGWFRNAE